MEKNKDAIDTTFVEVETKETIKEKGKKVGDKILSYGKNTIDYIKSDPVDAIVKVGTALTAVVAIMTAVGTISKISNASKTVHSKEIGEDILLKKKLNNNDKVELDYRVKTGQTKIEALNNMGYIR